LLAAWNRRKAGGLWDLLTIVSRDKELIQSFKHASRMVYWRCTPFLAKGGANFLIKSFFI
jgi:hypothetical protein